MKPIRIVRTIYPPIPRLLFNEWMQYIHHSVNESKKFENGKD